jgi:hypothetical protein
MCDDTATGTSKTGHISGSIIDAICQLWDSGLRKEAMEAVDSYCSCSQSAPVAAKLLEIGVSTHGWYPGAI